MGTPPRDTSSGAPAAAAIVRAQGDRLAARALEAAIDADPTFRTRYDEIGLRRLLRDSRSMLDRLADSLAYGDPTLVREWADWVAPVFRRRLVPMDDLVAIAEGLRRALAAAVAPADQHRVHEAIDEAIAVFRWYRRIAGDARKRNRFLSFIYKGA